MTLLIRQQITGLKFFVEYDKDIAALDLRFHLLYFFRQAVFSFAIVRALAINIFLD